MVLKPFNFKNRNLYYDKINLRIFCILLPMQRNIFLKISCFVSIFDIS